MWTLISFQAMSSLQNRAEQKTSVIEETSKLLFVLHLELDWLETALHVYCVTKLVYSSFLHHVNL